MITIFLSENTNGSVKYFQGLDPSANLIPPKEENHTKCTGVMPFRPTIKATLNVGIRLNVRNVLNLV